MSTKRLQRTYLLRGLDRVLYSRSPKWREGAFEQLQSDCGHLILHADNITSSAALGEAVRSIDQIAERFRLAIAKRTVRPLKLTLERSDEPSFGTPSVTRLQGGISVSDQPECSISPCDPPGEIEQIHENADRWIQTLVETSNFGAYPDEILKRLYLLIEELEQDYRQLLADNQRTVLQELKWIRDFVSHPTCRHQPLCKFITTCLPDAVVSTNPLLVRFDRTNVNHKNFIGGYEPKVRAIAVTLLNAAIAGR